MLSLIFAFCAFLAILVGGFIGIRHHAKLNYIISFTAGVLIAVVFFDLLPEISRMANSLSVGMAFPMLFLVLGFLVIHILEKMSAIHHVHGEDCNVRHPTVGVVSAIGMALHSFMDGVGIGMGFHINPAIGIIIAIAVIAHGFCDGLNIVSVMLLNKNNRKRTVKFLLLDAIAPILGLALTFLLQIPDSFLMIFLSFFAGFLLYIGAADLLPEAHSKKSSWVLIGLTVLGMAFIFLVTRLT
jgi:ZIP family zinc transporter